MFIECCKKGGCFDDIEIVCIGIFDEGLFDYVLWLVRWYVVFGLVIKIWVYVFDYFLNCDVCIIFLIELFGMDVVVLIDIICEN